MARVTLFSMTVFCAFFPKVVQRPEALLRIRAFSASPNRVDDERMRADVVLALGIGRLLS